VTASRPRLGISAASWLIKSDTPHPILHCDQWASAICREAEWAIPRRRNAATISITP